MKPDSFFDNHFWPFIKYDEKINVIFVISAILASFLNVYQIPLTW